MSAEEYISAALHRLIKRKEPELSSDGFFLFAALHMLMLALTFGARFAPGWPLAFLRVLLLSLATDNTVVALGAVSLEAPWYELLTRLRYALHALVLPGLSLYGLALPGPQKPAIWRAVVWPLALGCLLYGAWHEIVELVLQPAGAGQVPRLVSTQPGPPWATVVGNLVFLVLSGACWYRRGWPWAFVGGLVILLVNGALAGSALALPAGALAELQFLLLLLWTESRRPFFTQHALSR
ncbi:hypothetical protein FV139_02620 [Parahaliea maris]|uniref:Uncharacterized protein n=1 Tax=Parahaliea maris TaxID=2716870 RepID=A0A5C9A648_9GAMM|nr:hypothetical protein [Parahaliea maris]TXS96405.1 hypothetical protein FV139_02620 [Parahaliea maris]